MDKFLEMYYLPRLNHEELENLNRLISSEKIETATKNLKKNKTGPACIIEMYPGNLYDPINKCHSNKLKNLNFKPIFV